MNEPVFNETIKVALFGASGTRKTLQIGNLIERFGAENVGIVSCERGLNTIRSYIKDEQVFVCEDYADFRRAFAWAREKYSGADKWVCVDGGTRVMQWNAGEIWGSSDEAYAHLAMGKKRHELDERLRPFLRFITKEGEIDGQRQWIQIGRDADRLLNAWVKLPCNMYWTFWETQTSIDQYRKGLPWQVDAPGNASRDAIIGTFDYVLRLFYDDGKLIADCSPASRVGRIKVRDDWNGGVKLPEAMPDFNLAALVGLLRGEQRA